MVRFGRRDRPAPGSEDTVIKRICVALVAALMLFHPLAAQASEVPRKAERHEVAKYQTGGGFEVTTDQDVVVTGEHQVLVCIDPTTGLTTIGQGLLSVEGEAAAIESGQCRPYVQGESNVPAEHDDVCQEDEPCWDCHTMGNLICGVENDG